MGSEGTSRLERCCAAAQTVANMARLAKDVVLERVIHAMFSDEILCVPHLLTVAPQLLLMHKQHRLRMVLLAGYAQQRAVLDLPQAGEFAQHLRVSCTTKTPITWSRSYDFTMALPAVRSGATRSPGGLR